MYTTKAEWSSEKGWFKKSEILYYKLYKDGIYICSGGNTKEKINKIMLKHQDYEKEPKFKVFKLGSGEYQIFQKEEFNYYANDWYNPVYNSGEYLVASEIIYYKTLSEACKVLLEYERLEARKIKESVVCV